MVNGTPAAAYAGGNADASQVLQGDEAQFGVAGTIASAGTLAPATAPAATAAGGSKWME